MECIKNTETFMYESYSLIKNAYFIAYKINPNMGLGPN